MKKNEHVSIAVSQVSLCTPFIMSHSSSTRMYYMFVFVVSSVRVSCCSCPWCSLSSTLSFTTTKKKCLALFFNWYKNHSRFQINNFVIDHNDPFLSSLHAQLHLWGSSSSLHHLLSWQDLGHTPEGTAASPFPQAAEAAQSGG